MKVLHIGEYVHGGVATYLKTLFKGSKDTDITHYLMLSDYNSEKNWDLEKDKIFYYAYKRNWHYFITVICKINQTLQQVQPDIVHIHSTWAGVYARTLYLFKKKKVKIIYSPHGWCFLMDVSPVKKRAYFLIESILSYVTDVIINISKYEQYEAIQFGICPEKMTMIYNGVEEVKNNVNQTALNSINIDQSKINLLFVGRIDRQKGLDLFLKAYTKLSLNNLHLYVIGKGILEENESISNESTTYLGWVDNKEIDKYYEACDAVVVPSRWEGFGLVAIEAMRNRKPVIVSNRGALPELIVDGENGYVFDLDKMDEIENILISLEKNTLRNMGNNGYGRFKNEFNAKIFCRGTIKLYEQG